MLSSSKRPTLSKRWQKLRAAHWLLVPILLGAIVGLEDFQRQKSQVSQNYVQLASEVQHDKQQAALQLVQGCARQQSLAWLPTYLIERVFGYCRPLDGASLAGVDLIAANLGEAKLRSVNLHDSELTGANLSETDLRDADLSRAKLNSADLRDADLRDADLSYAKLRAADLRDANLIGAYLRHVDLRAANLAGAYLVGAYLRPARLSGTNLSYADLRHANLRHTNLSDANLSDAYLRHANLTDSYLRHANLHQADLRHANLNHADLSHAALRRADLSYADLSYANLRDADLKGTLLLATDLRHARNLTLEQLSGDDSPLLCNVALPHNLKSIHPSIELDQGCAAIQDVLIGTYNLTDAEAQRVIDAARALQWTAQEDSGEFL